MLMLFAVGFVAMARRLPRPGGFYAYISASLGKPLGLGASYVAVLGYLGLLLGTYLLGGAAADALVHGKFGGPELPWAFWAFFMWLFVSALGHFRIDLSAKVLGVLLCAELVVVVVFDVVVLARGGGPEGISAEPLTIDAFFSGSVPIAIMFAILTYTGFESTAIYREEVRDPDRTITRATYGSILLLGGLYTVSSFMLINGYGVSNAVAVATNNSGVMMVDAVEEYVGVIMADLTNVLLVTSSLAALLAIHNTATRYVYSLATDKAAPPIFGRVHPVHGSPYLASAGVAVLAIVCTVPFAVSNLSFLEQYSWMLGIGTLALIVLYTLMSLAVLVFFIREPGDEGVARTRVAPALALVMLTATLWLITKNLTLLTGGSTTLSFVFSAAVYGLLLLGVVVALYYKSRKPEVYEALGRSLG
ncbi:amino acid transporter [Nocardioides cavernae]|nr:amino acid transporter [Nocardioides cavernae]